MFIFSSQSDQIIILRNRVNMQHLSRSIRDFLLKETNWGKVEKKIKRLGKKIKLVNS